MIPKIIHYCWFGHQPKKKLNIKCIQSWKQYCEGWQIIEWNENNFDITSAPLYVRQAYEAKTWSAVTNYVRLKVVYEHGGVYLDTDVELLKPLTPLLHFDAYFGLCQLDHVINTGLGFGAIKGAPILKEMMQNYESRTFIKTKKARDRITCPEIDTDAFLKHGMKQENVCQILANNVAILPSGILDPFDYFTCELHATDNTISIHWAQGSWWGTYDLMIYWLGIYWYKLKQRIKHILRKYENIR